MMAAMSEPACPPPPVEPEPSDCCGEGCSNCVFDQYEAAVERWRRQQAAWQERRLQAGGSPGSVADERPPD
jgi:hypothetical protein